MKQRRYGETGCQYVEIDGRYAYEWAGAPPLEVGEKVLVPATWLDELQGSTGPKLGLVTALGSTYDGVHTGVLRRAS